MKQSYQGWGTDNNTGDEALRRDWKEAPSPGLPEIRAWAYRDKEIHVGNDMMDALGRVNAKMETPGVAYGTMIIENNWNLTFKIDGNNHVPSDMLNRQFKQYAKSNFKNLVKVANDPGSGWQTVPDMWRRKEWGEETEISDAPNVTSPVSDMAMSDAYECSECGEKFTGYEEYERHLSEHGNYSDDSMEPVKPVVDLDQQLPANYDRDTRPGGWPGIHTGSWTLLSETSIAGPIPFLYDVHEDEIHVGQPGDLEVPEDPDIKFNVDGVVEGFYFPDGKLQVRTMTDVPYTIRHLIQLWYYMHPELEVKSVTILRQNGKEEKVSNTPPDQPPMKKPAPDKFKTESDNYNEEAKRYWETQKQQNKRAALDPDLHANLHESPYGNWAVHETSGYSVLPIMRHGLVPWNRLDSGSVYQGDLTPRQDRVYLRLAKKKNWGIDEPIFTDLQELDPERIGADEDWIDHYSIEHFKKKGVPGAEEMIPHDDGINSGMTRGEHSDKWSHVVDHPIVVEHSMKGYGGSTNWGGTVAYHGGLPGNSLVFNAEKLRGKGYGVSAYTDHALFKNLGESDGIESYKARMRVRMAEVLEDLKEKYEHFTNNPVRFGRVVDSPEDGIYPYKNPYKKIEHVSPEENDLMNRELLGHLLRKINGLTLDLQEQK